MPLKIDNIGEGSFQGQLPAAPSNPINGWTYVNTIDYGYYLYAFGVWQLIFTLTPPIPADFTGIPIGFSNMLHLTYP